MRSAGVLAALSLVAISCASTTSRRSVSETAASMPRPFVIWPDRTPVPVEGYDRPPSAPFDRADLVIQPEEMRSFYGPPGEFGYYMDGGDYGFANLSFIVTETHPGGGPDLHRHDSEEAHILLSGRITYLIGDRQFTVEGPYVARVPAGVPHAFVNAGSTPFHLIAVFPDPHPAYIHIGDNPLLTTCRQPSAAPPRP